MINDAWFTIEELSSRTYAISEYGHWEEPHSYLFIGNKKAALVDTGLGIGKIKNVIQRLTNTPVFIVTTHCHWDHIGGHNEFDDIAIHKNDQGWLENGLPISISFIRDQLMKLPFTKAAPDNFNPDSYEAYTGKPSYVLNDGDCIDIGGRSLCVIHTPGHSPGHICLLEEQTGFLCTGDLLYQGTIQACYPSCDPVALQDSIERIAKIPGIKRLLPGHHNLHVQVSLLQTAKTELRKINSAGRLKHGTGLHGNEKIRFAF